MKNLRTLFSLLILSLALTGIYAQNSNQKLPVDPKVRYGKLNNGLTYYIRHNNYPENRATFYIAQKVGAMQEEDDQNGLAHFLEHMAFNGTKNFPGRGNVFRTLEHYGLKFGRNINAYTSFDQTVYFLSDLPTTNQNALDTALLIIHDWSNNISLLDEDIDKERGIIKEEWRTYAGAGERIWNKTRPILFKGSKYATRNVIGDMDVVENFEYQTLKDYYKKWYRPDLQAVILVGDFDVDVMEAKLKTMFADIPKAVNPAERIYYPVVDNDEPLIAIASDPEMTMMNVSVYFKHDIVPQQVKETQAGYCTVVERNMATTMLSNRLREITQKPNAPITSAYAYDGQYYIAVTKDAWVIGAGCQETHLKVALETIFREVERVKRFGFTQAEVDRVKASILANYESQYNNRNKTNTSQLGQEYIRAFINNEPIPGIEYEYEFVKKIMPTIDLASIDKYVKGVLTDKNIAISISGPEKDGLVYLSETEVLSVIGNSKKETIEAYTEKEISTTLIAELPKPGKIVKTEKDAKLGTTIWTLSNGVKVVIKPTDFKDDDIVMIATAKGGTDVYADSEIQNANLISFVAQSGGLGAFSATDLQKALAGKRAYARLDIGGKEKRVYGGSNTRDFETMLQLVYLNFTDIRKDTDAFIAGTDKMKNFYRNQASNPNKAFGDSINFAFYGDNLRRKPTTVEDVEKLDYDRILEMTRENFDNANGFVFTFVGTIDEATARPLVEQYLATLPSSKTTKTKPNVAKDDVRRGIYNSHFENAMKEPKALVFDYFSGTVERNQKNILTGAILRNILDMVYMEKVREEMSGTYGVRTNVAIDRYPDGFVKIMAQFSTDPDKAEALNNIVKRELNNIAANGVREVDFKKTKEYFAKTFQENVKQNGYWSNVLNNIYFFNEDGYSNYEALLNSITMDDVKNFTNSILSQNNAIEVIMMPKE